MLTENEARELLRRAAETIDVALSAPLVVPTRRRWVAPVVAAAAVLASVMVGFTVIDDHDGPISAPINGPTPSPAQPDDPVDPTAVSIAGRLFLFAQDPPGARFPGRERVRFYTEGIFWTSLTGPQAENRRNYSLCSGLAAAQCGASYLSALKFLGGYTVVSQLPSCYDPSRLVGQGRGGGSRTAYVLSKSQDACSSAVQVRYDPPDRLVAVNVLSTWPDPERDLRELADRFIDFARGKKDRLPVDTPVRLYQNEKLVRTLSASEAEDRGSYRTCGAKPCSFSAIEVIRDVLEEPAVRRDTRVPACLEAHPPGLTVAETGGTRSILVSDVDHPCAWGVQLWFNDVDQIVAIDLRVRELS